MVDLSLKEFTGRLASSDAVPGGGGAGALAGALGAALGAMAASLTVNKKKYADVQPLMQQSMDGLRDISQTLLALVMKDAEAFEPLSKAYGMPRDTEEKQRQKDVVMQAALKQAAQPPLEMMRVCCRALEILESLVDTVSPLVVSDVGCGASLCRACMESASLNVYINAKMLSDKALAEDIAAETDRLLRSGRDMAEGIFNKTEEKIWPRN